MHILSHVNTYDAVQAHKHDNISMQLQKGQMKASITSSFKCVHVCVCVCVRLIYITMPTYTGTVSEEK